MIKIITLVLLVFFTGPWIVDQMNFEGSAQFPSAAILPIDAINGRLVQPSPAASIARGKKVYEAYCLACHQADGTGVPRLNPPLVKTSFVLGDKKILVGIILNGMEQEIEIDGEVYSNIMASHDFLKDQEIADVLTYVRNSFGNKASSVSPAEVAAIRAAKKK